MKQLVSIITPTTISRSHFIPGLQAMIAAQDYSNIEHIIVDDEKLTVGEKRNIGCARAKGDIILHMDSDDMYAPDWVSKSVAALEGCDITGLSQAHFYNISTGEAWKYCFSDDPFAAYALGATLCYRKTFWEGNKYRHINVGEDTRFVLDGDCIKKSHSYIEGFLSLIHSDNTSFREYKSYRWKRLGNGETEKITLLKKLDRALSNQAPLQ